MTRAKVCLLLAIAIAASCAYLCNRPNRGIKIELAQASNQQPLTRADLIWILDARGSLFQSQEQGQRQGRALWPDQIDQILHDESRNQHPKIELLIDKACRFESLAPILSLCSKYGVKLQLRLQPATQLENLPKELPKGLPENSNPSLPSQTPSSDPPSTLSTKQRGKNSG